MKNIFKWFGWFLVFISLVVIFSGSVSAKKSDQALVVLPAQETVNGNYYASGSTVEVRGHVLSDVFVAGGTVEISGDVDGDVFVMGGNVRLTGRVGGNVRAVGGTVEILGSVTKNVLAGAGTLKFLPNSSIGGHITAAAGTLDISGSISGSVKAASGTVNLLGSINGPAEYWLGQDGQIKVGSTAVLLEPVIYHSQNENQAVIDEGANLTYPLEFSKVNVKNYSRANNWWNWLVGIFSSLVLAMVFITWWPKFWQNASETILKRPWPSLGWGAVWTVFVPILSIIFLITVIGWPLAVLLMAAYLAGFIVVPVLAGLVIANYLKTFKPINKLIVKWPIMLQVFLGIILYKIIVSLPYLGGLLLVLVALAVWGALWQSIRLSFNK